jgi:hypothetical protein
MYKLAKRVLSVALLATAAPSMAASILFAGGTASGSNGLIFNAGSGADQVSVRVSAWTLGTNGNTISASQLGVYSGGLGVTNSQEGSGGGNSHTIDNLNGTDFVILQFNKNVILGDATFTAFQQTGLSYTDTDATIGWGKTNTAWNSVLNLSTLANLNSLIPASNLYDSGNSGSQGTNTRNIDPGLLSGNVWIVSAAFAADNFDLDGRNPKVDSFKLNGLNYTVAVPEPATWMMMILGFGFMGGMVRRSKVSAPLIEATN